MWSIGTDGRISIITKILLILVVGIYMILVVILNRLNQRSAAVAGKTVGKPLTPGSHQAVVKAIATAISSGDHGGDPGHRGCSFPATFQASTTRAVGFTT